MTETFDVSLKTKQNCVYLLQAAADFFTENPKAWCQGTIARNSEGEDIEFWGDGGDVKSARHKKACQWCAVGIIYKLASKYYVKADIAEDLVRNIEANELADESDYLVNWNDQDKRRRQSVIALFKRAAKRLEKEIKNEVKQAA